MKQLSFLILLLGVMLYSCKDSVVDPPPPGNNEYQKIYTANSGNITFDMYSATSNKLIYGYNDIGFKVYLDGNAMDTGFVDFKAIMYHGLGGPNHSTPVDDRFVYNSDKQMFMGYASFIMVDTSAFWVGKFNYSNAASVDSSIIDVFNSNNQTFLWANFNTQMFYVMTLIKPVNPAVGLNDYSLLFHESDDQNYFTEVNNAEIFIKPWMETMGHGSSNNVNPVSVGNSRYEGKVNFTMSGDWVVYDSIKLNNVWISKVPLHKFNFTVN